MTSRTERFLKLLEVEGVTLAAIAERSGLSRSKLTAMRGGDTRVTGAAMRAARDVAEESLQRSIAAFQEGRQRHTSSVYLDHPIERRDRGRRRLRITRNIHQGKAFVHLREWTPPHSCFDEGKPTDVGIGADPAMWRDLIIPALVEASSVDEDEHDIAASDMDEE